MQKGQTTMADLNNELDLNAPVAPTQTQDYAPDDPEKAHYPTEG